MYVCTYLVKRDVDDDYMVGSVVNARSRVAGVKSFSRRTNLLIHPGKSHGGVLSSWSKYLHSCTCKVLRAAVVAKEKERPTAAYTALELSVLSLCATFRNSSRDLSCTLAYTF